MELTQKQIEQIKEMYPSGTKVECIRMDDPYHAIPSGMMGIVDHVDDGILFLASTELWGHLPQIRLLGKTLRPWCFIYDIKAKK